MVAPRIIDRTTFCEVLGEARAMTDALLAADPSWALPRHIALQLEHISASTTGEQVPDEHARGSVDVGPIAAREFTGSYDVYAGLLMDIDYAFHRYDALLGPFHGSGRRGILQVFYGPEAFRKHIIEPGQRVVVGRGERADVVLSGRGSGDGQQALGARHVEIWWDGIVCQVRDLDGPGGITLNGLPALRGELQNGGVIGAGPYTLRFFVEGHTPPEQQAPSRGDVAAVRAALADSLERGELYAVLDAARSRRILCLLNEAVDAHASLYEGDRGRALDTAAPYLVQLSPRSRLIDRLLAEGWGYAWGIWLTSGALRKQVRRSLRRLLMVQAEGRRERMYFRFYDPRVLARFMPLTTVRQDSELFAAADAIHFEDAEANLRTIVRPALTSGGTNPEEGSEA